MGAILTFLGRKPPETPIKGCGPRLKSIAQHNFRGLLGVLVPFCILVWQLKLKNAGVTTLHIYILMACFFLFQPVSIQVTGMIPIFAMPMLGIMSTPIIVNNYFNEGIALFIIGGMLHLLLNNSGLDRRIALCMLCKGDAKSFSPGKLLCKCSFAAFILSIFCHRLIVASTLIQYITPVLMDLQKSTARYRATEPEFDQIRYIICNAIQTSCSIGGIAVMHSSYCTMAFRAIFYESMNYPDVLNYAQYSAFAFPLAFVLFLVNLIYHGLMLKCCGGKPITESRMNTARTAILKYKSQIPSKITNHEKLTIFFEALALVTFIGRNIQAKDKGWAKQIKLAAPIGDATVAAMFVIFLHILPRSCNFCKVLQAKKKSQLPPRKPESAILFWRFVDKNTNYGYFFVIGAGIVLHAVFSVGGKDAAGVKLSDGLKFITDLDFCIAVLVISLITVALTNMISGVAAVSIWLPVVLHLRNGQNLDSPWIKKMYRPALAVGIGSSFGYISPFLYTPAYFCHHIGKVPKRIMLKYSLLPCIISAILLYLATCYYAPIIFGEDVIGIPYSIEDKETTTVKTEGQGSTDDNKTTVAP